MAVWTDQVGHADSANRNAGTARSQRPHDPVMAITDGHLHLARWPGSPGHGYVVTS
jgi:hypothetical protein